MNPYEPPISPHPFLDAPSEIVRDVPNHLGRIVFGAAIRVIGVLVGMNGIKWFYFGFTHLIYPADEVRIMEYAISAIGYSVGGVLLFYGAPYFESAGYPKHGFEQREPTADEQDD